MGPCRTFCVAPKQSVASVGRFKGPVASIGHFKATTRSTLVTVNKCLPAEFNKQRSRRQASQYTGIIVLQIAEQY